MLNREILNNELAQEVMASKPVTITENIAIVHRIQSGDKKADSEFIVKNGRRVLDIIDKYNFDSIIQLDLFQIGLMAMLETAKKMDENQLSWLLLRIDRDVLYHISQFIHENHEMVQMPSFCAKNKARILQYFECKDELPEMTLEKIAETFEVDERTVRKDLAADLDYEYELSSKYSPDTLFDKELLSEAIASRVSSLRPREQEVIFLRYLNPDGPATLKEAGKVLGCCGNAVRMTEAKALRKLRHPSRSGLLRGFMYEDCLANYPCQVPGVQPVHRGFRKKGNE